MSDKTTQEKIREILDVLTAETFWTWETAERDIYIEKSVSVIIALIEQGKIEFAEKHKEALADMVNQYAFRGTNGKVPILYTGGMSALEQAFDVLGYSDPHDFPEAKCETENCPEPSTCGTPTKDGYKRLCGKCYQNIRKGKGE